MSRKRPGWRAAERTYQYLTKDLARKAMSSRESDLRAALSLCVKELRAMHAHYQPTCVAHGDHSKPILNQPDLTCPTWEAIHAAEAALAQKASL